MHSSRAFLSLAVLLVSATTLFAQPGITEPLSTDISSIRGDTWSVGSVAVDNYFFKLEAVVDPNNRTVQNTVIMSSTGGISYPNRAFRYPKEEFHYNAVDWRGTGPGTHTVYAFVFWPDGYGAVSGNYYNAGSMFLTYDVTITP